MENRISPQRYAACESMSPSKLSYVELCLWDTHRPQLTRACLFDDIDRQLLIVKYIFIPKGESPLLCILIKK